MFLQRQKVEPNLKPTPAILKPVTSQNPKRQPAWTSTLGSQPTLTLQPKLTINQPGDEYEQEADHIASQVMRMPTPTVQRCACGGVAGTDGECAACKAKRLGVQRKSDGIAHTEAPPSVHQTLNKSGQPLDASTRAFMEPRFGQDFSNVRVHTDSHAARSAADVSARAYTVGNNVVFGAGEYAPNSSNGQSLIAHELTHTLQQTSERSSTSSVKNGDLPGDILHRHTTSDCDTSQRSLIATAISKAQANLTTVITEVAKRPLTSDMENALWLYFRDSSSTTADTVSKNFNFILSKIAGLSYECENDCVEDQMGYTYVGTAITGFGSIHLCMNNLGTDADKVSDTLIHEIAHYVLLANDEFGYYGNSCEESDTTVTARSGSKLALADSYNCFVRNWISGNITDRANAKGDLSGANIAGISQSPVGSIDLNSASPKKPMFSIKLSRGPLAMVTGVSYRWMLRDDQDRSYLMTDTSGNELSQFKPAVESINAIINSKTRALLKERNIISGRVLCRAISPVFSDKVFEFPVTFTV